MERQDIDVLIIQKQSQPERLLLCRPMDKKKSGNTKGLPENPGRREILARTCCPPENRHGTA